MDANEVGYLFGRVAIFAAIFAVGGSLIIYIPALIHLVLTKTGIFLEYKPPEHYRRRNITGDDTNQFHGYYEQPYFRKYPANSCKNYFFNNFLLLIMTGIQVGMLVCLAVLFIVAFGINLSELATSAMFSTVFAWFHFADHIKGYSAYLWFIWSNKLRLGNEIDIEGHRGDLVELGPVTSYIYVYMRAVNLIGSADPPPQDRPRPLVNPEDLKQLGHDNTHLFHRKSSNNNESLSHMTRLIVGQTGGTVLNGPPPPPNHHIITMPSSMPVASIGATSLRHFNRPREVIPTPESLSTGKLQMIHPGYVSLPVEEHYRLAVPTNVFMTANYRNYSYKQVHVTITEIKD